MGSWLLPARDCARAHSDYRQRPIRKPRPCSTTQRLQLVPSIDASANSEMVDLSLSDDSLSNLIGEVEAQRLLAARGLGALPSIAVRSIRTCVLATRL